MAEIVTNGRRLKLRPGVGDALDNAKQPVPTRGWQRRVYRVGHGDRPTERFPVYGVPSIEKVDADLAMIRAHFGVNQSDAFRLALHLTANAIRKNRATPEV